MSSKTLDDLFSSLKLIEQNPNNFNYFEDFENVVGQIGALKDSDCIPLLIQFLNDKSGEWDLMYGIIHTIEIFDIKTYIEKILISSPHLYKNSPEWGSMIFMRILNSDEYKVELIRQLREASMIIKESVKNIMEEINKESPEFLAKTVSVTVAATV